jgi:RNA polymerase sigma-70 factor (ECF subfamily)
MTDPGLSDVELVNRILGGDGSFFEHVVKRYERLVYGFMLRKISDVGVAQDLAQETFLIGYENLARLKDHKRRKMAGMPEGHDPELVGMDPLQTAEQHERHEVLYKALSKLSERYRAVLVKRYLEGLEYPQIAEELGLSIGAVEVCMHRARKSLGAALKELMPDIDS